MMLRPISRYVLVWRGALPLLAAVAAGCGKAPPANPEPLPAPDPPPASVVTLVDTVRVTDPDLEQRASRLELQLLEKEAQVEALQQQLDEARREVVRAMAKLQTLASRAEAASGMAEAELALQSLRTTPGSTSAGEVTQAASMLQMSSAEFNRQNYGGALYLASQAKSMATSGRTRLDSGDRTARQGEVIFALPVPLRAQGRSNVREGPGTRYSVLFTVDEGTPLTGYSYSEDWVRIRDQEGRSGWIFQGLLGRRPDAQP